MRSRDAADDALAGRGPGDLAGRQDWRDEPADDDWQEDEDGLLSRRFGRAGAAPDPEPACRGKVRVRKRRRFRGKAASTIAVMAVVLVVAVAGLFGYKFVHGWISNRYGDYSGPGTGTVQVIVNGGDTLAGLGPELVKKGVVMTLRPYDTAAAAAAASGTLQPGIYKLHHHMNSTLAVQLLLSPKARIANRVTIIEGTRATDIAAELAKYTHHKASAFLDIIENPPATLGLPSWAHGNSAEGFLFPDTYDFVPSQSPLQILQTMVREFNHKVGSINVESESAKVNTTPWHVLIVASMIQAEGGRVQDFPGISRVAWHRLTLSRPLQFDSTVFYAMHTYGTSLTAKQEKFKSPYNTYLHTGLPPTPIGNPGVAAIKAALHPVKTDYLYFITDTRKKPYITHFTNSLKQLQRWQQEFQG